MEINYGQNKTMQQMYRFMLKYDWKYWQMPCDPVITVHILWPYCTCPTKLYMNIKLKSILKDRILLID